MDEERKIAKKRKLNMKLYPTYKMLAADWLFFNAVKVLFLTQVKPFSNADVVFSETIYAFFKMMLQIPASVIVSKIGIRKCSIIGNIFWILEGVLIMLSLNYFMLILSQFFSAIAWSFKTISDDTMLSKSIPEAKSKGRIFSHLNSKGYSRYCYISAIATLLSGFLYEINPYIPIILSVTFMTIALIISINFFDIQKEDSKTFKESIGDVKEGVKFIVKSPRLKSLLLTLGFMWGSICLFGTYQNTLLKDIHVPAKYIGIILALLDIIQGFASTRANNFNERHKNNSLSLLSISACICIFVAGLVVAIGLPRIPALSIIIFSYIIRMSDKGIYKIISKRYMNNFMTAKMQTKIYSVQSIISSIFRMTIGAIGSYLLTVVTIEHAMIIIGILLSFVSIIFYLYMKPRLGLKPEEYNDKDIVVTRL